METAQLKEYWYSYINSKSKGSDLEQVCRPNFSIVDFCTLSAYSMELLGPGNTLLDIGAGNGLIDIVFSPHFKKIIAIEPLDNYDALVKNTKHIAKIKTYKAFGESVVLKEKNIDRVLMAAVAYVWPRMIYEIFDNLDKNLAKKCRILVTELTDAEKWEKYLADLPALLKGKGFTDERIEAILKSNKMSSVHHYADLQKYFKTLGFKTKKLPTNPLHPVAQVRFDLLAER